MGVYIKGMNMPKKCASCMLAFQDQDSEHNVYWTCAPLNKDALRLERRPDCPLVEVPTPHGKLIDRDKLAMHMTKAHKEWREHYELHKYVVPTWDDLIMVWCFPAVIEAEDGER